MLTPADQLLALLIVVVLPLRAWFGMRALKTAPAERLPALRRGLWVRAIASQWLLVVLVLAVWLGAHRSLLTLGLGLRANGGLLGVLVGTLSIAIIMVRQRPAVDADEAVRARIREQLAPVERLMPRGAAGLPPFPVS